MSLRPPEPTWTDAIISVAVMMAGLLILWFLLPAAAELDPIELIHLMGD